MCGEEQMQEVIILYTGGLQVFNSIRGCQICLKYKSCIEILHVIFLF